jgi:hypothetical protein
VSIEGPSEIRNRHAPSGDSIGRRAGIPPEAQLAGWSRFEWSYGWLVLYGGLFLAVIRPDSGADLKYHWASCAVIVAAGCYWAIRGAARHVAAAITLWLCAVGAAVLAATWSSSQTDGSTIAGLLPYSDAFNYFADAQRILAGVPISSFSSRRPMFAAWLAGLLAVSGNDLRRTLILISLLISISLAAATLVFRRDRGGGAAILYAVVIWLFYRHFVGTTLTEHLGLGLGLLSFALLWCGARQRVLAWTALGVWLLTLALNARAGTFLALPIVAYWMGVFWAPAGHRFCWRAAGFGAAAILAGFAANRLLLIGLAGSGAAAFSNFSYSLYGLVMGGDWTLALQQHPELSLLQPDAQAEAVYRLAYTQILSHPTSLLVGAIRAWEAFALSAFSFAANVTESSFDLLGTFVLSLLAARGATVIWHERRDPAVGVVTAVLIGVIASVPFVPPWDADSMRAYAATMPFLAAVPAFGFSGLLRKPAATENRRVAEGAPLMLAGGAIFVVVSCFGLPIAVRGTRAVPAISAEAPRAVYEQAVRAALIPGTVVHVVPGAVRIDKELRGLITQDPLAAIGRLGATLWPSAVRVGQLVQGASSGHAPADAARLVRTLQEGETLGIAAFRQNAGMQVTLVCFYSSRSQSADGNGGDCAAQDAGRADEYLVR